MRIVFMGTPDFAVPSLERLIQATHIHNSELYSALACKLL